MKLNPAPPLASLCATPPEWQPAVKLSELCELIFAQLQDEMPIADQCRFWAGFIRRGKLPLVTLSFSGGKSLHGVVRVNAPDAETWARYRAQIVERYAADPDKAYRLDVQALNPLTGCRLAGVMRKDTGKVQELLFACELVTIARYGVMIAGDDCIGGNGDDSGMTIRGRVIDG